MFSIFHGNRLIGHSELELGDPPMGVAQGKFLATDEFALLRGAMRPGCDSFGNEAPDSRVLGGPSLSVKSAEGTVVVCEAVLVCEYGDVEDPFFVEVMCLGIGYPLYGELFPGHVQKYDSSFLDEN